MPTVADRHDAPTAIQTNLAAIFISLELSRSIWLITSLSPGFAGKMSKHSVQAGDVAALLARVSELKRKASERTGKSFPVVVIQEAGLDGFWLHRVLQSEGLESHVVDPASIATSRRRRRAKTDRIDGEALLRALLAFKRGEPRVCAMVKAPTPEEEDRRRLSRERKVLVAERVKHVNRVKGLLFSQGVSGYEPLRRDRRQRFEDLTTGDGRSLPMHLKTQISRELDRLELLLDQIKQAETERTRCLPRNRPPRRRRRGGCCLSSRASVRSLPPASGWRRYSAASTIAASSRHTRGWRRRPGKADRSITSRESPRPVIRDCEPP
jgi:transposase